ncbi:NmrA/HSCARG family protein [Paraburkholderia sp. BCC1886]|uniref:NmrA/HSCARG family protein n=1 Tax=Paraburkholderia sp. BCC1886 TaxID=2562670 RepID=UPI0011844A75|nr:NmrA/HSCARG family protein [Paraburkholderia sp. BCC1886]
MSLNNQEAGQRAASRKTVLVFGATGQQGGAVAHSLLAKGWAVRALVRDPASGKAKALAAEGVALLQGDFSDSASIRKAMTGAHGVFSVQPSSGQGALYGISDEQEIRYGKTIADLAVETGVQHLVYSSVNAAGPEKTGMGHFDSKAEIEAYIRSLDIPSTIIRPSGFMELLMLPGMGLDKNIYTSFLRPEQTGQVIAVQDIGKIVATILSAPERFVGRTIEIAGDELTGLRLQDSLSRAAGKPIAYYRFPDSLLEENAFLGRLAALFDDGRLAGHADLPALRAEFGPLLSFDEWLAGPGKALFEAALRADDAPIALR